MKPIFMNEDAYKLMGTQDSREKSIVEIAEYGLKESDITAVETFLKTEMADGFFFLCTECENVSKELHEIALNVCAQNDEGFYSPFRALEEALEMEIGKECMGYDPLQYVCQYKATSPKLKHPFLYSCECGISAQYFHIDDYETVKGMLEGQLN